MKKLKALLGKLFGKSDAPDSNLAAKSKNKLAKQRLRIYANLDEPHGYRINGQTDYEGRFNDLQYLIAIAETAEHLRRIVEYECRNHWCAPEYTIDWKQIWRKWVLLATTIADLEQMWKYSRQLSADPKNALIRKWYALAITYSEISSIPHSGDEVLQSLIDTKKVELVQKAFELPTTCSELIEVWQEIQHYSKPTSLTGYQSWNNDEGSTAKEIASFYQSLSSDIPLRTEAGEKYLKLCLREIEASQSTLDMAILKYHVHPDARQALIEKWDSLSVAEVANAVEEQVIAEVLRRSRTGSTAGQTALTRLEAINLERVQKASTPGELWSVISKHWVPHNYPSIRLAIEKYADLATTEEEIRKIWSWIKEMPEVKDSLLGKLSALIK